jgi:DNA-binding response OmpR family regulator
LPGARKLFYGGRSVELGSRAFDLLLCLLRSRGRVVSKNEIVAEVWPTTFVEESNLRFQMATLRKALGADSDIIKTIPGRGYLLIEEWDEGHGSYRWSARSSSPRPNGGGSHDAAPQKPSPGDGGVPISETAPLVGVIDPDVEITDEISKLLTHEGFCVRSHYSIENFLGGEGRCDLDCLILEWRLPGRSGMDVQRDLARLRPDIPLIFMSAHADVHSAVQAMKLGAIDFLLKPVRHLELLAALRLVIGRDRWPH